MWALQLYQLSHAIFVVCLFFQDKTTKSRQGLLPALIFGLVGQMSVTLHLYALDGVSLAIAEDVDFLIYNNLLYGF